jgi:hypothetical protein
VSPAIRLNHGLGSVARLFQSHRNLRVPRRGIGSRPGFCECTTLAALIESFCSAEVIAFAAEFALRRRRSRALFAWTWLCPRQFLSPA